MQKTPRRRLTGDVTEKEWGWLTGMNANPFMILDRVPDDRLAALWEEHEAEIRRLWARDGAPAALPSGHPVVNGKGEHFECVGWRRQGSVQRCWRCQLAIRGEPIPPMPREFDPRWVLRMNAGTPEYERWTARRQAWLHHGDADVAA